MSTISITFETQILDFSPLNEGQVVVNYNDGNVDIALPLNLTFSAAARGFFSNIPYSSSDSGEESNEAQAQSFATSFNRDYAYVGDQGGSGIRRSNLTTTVLDNVVTIEATVGTFIDATYNGNVLIVSPSAPNNTNQVDHISFSVNRLDTGNCSSVNYTSSVTGGESPYELRDSNSLITSNWDGSSLGFSLLRGGSNYTSLSVTDALGTVVSKQVYIPRNITSGEFDVSQVQYVGGNDVVVNTVTLVSGTTPYTYALENQGALTGITYQSSNTFQTVAEGIYELFIKDVYGCEVKKTITVNVDQGGLLTENPRYFQIMDGNSVIFSECKSFDHNNKKNHTNTISTNELADINYEIEQHFDPNDIVATQFKSSYDYHNITMHKSDGAKIGLEPLMIQENLGFYERVDCVLIPFDGQVAMYFDGGNSYKVDTNTVIGASEYNEFSPDWAVSGQVVSIEGYGSFEIQDENYSSDLGKSLYLLNFTINSSENAIVQTKFNKQQYNVFEFIFVLQEGEKARIVIEKGFNFSNVEGNKFISEKLIGKIDEPEDILIRWYDSKNKGDIVFQSGIEYIKRRKGSFRPLPNGNAETFNGDSRTYSLSQSAYLGYILRFEAITVKEAYQLSIASGLEFFIVNNLNMVRTSFPSIEPIDGTNLYSFEVELSYGGNSLALQSDEVVLNPSTGSETFDLEILQFDNKTRLEVDGRFLTIDGKYVSID